MVEFGPEPIYESDGEEDHLDECVLKMFNKKEKKKKPIRLVKKGKKKKEIAWGLHL